MSLVLASGCEGDDALGPVEEGFGGESSVAQGGAGVGGGGNHDAVWGGDAGAASGGGAGPGADPASPGASAGIGGAGEGGSDAAGGAGEGGNAPGRGEGGQGGTGAEAPACFTLVGIGGDFPHEHEMYVPFADVLAGKPRLYEMFGDHGHTVLFDEQDFARLAAGEAVEKVSSFSAPGPHVHRVRVVCA